MCGITGVYSLHPPLPDSGAELIRRMNRVQVHRGPDDDGLEIFPHCVLGHRRLAIIDLSKNGHQPFFSPDGRFCLTYNGEIYNYLELREELKALGFAFTTQTDTEVLLQAYMAWGKEALCRLNGMFALAIYDTQARSLFLARDRVGIKPLYYTWMDDACFFASEIKALRILPGLGSELNEPALFDFLVFNRTDVYDETFLKQVKRLPKGHWMEIGPHGTKMKPWWKPQDYLYPNRKVHKPYEIIERIFLDSVRLRMRSDVPVGSCLSGGLDSSILVGALYKQHLADGSFATFTASFPGSSLDESHYVDALNRVFPFQNYRTYPTARTALENLAIFTRVNDEPTTNPSFYAQYEVMRLAKAHGVTVLLDGQGGDENFAGYQYFHGFYLVGLLQEWRLGRLAGELLNILWRRQDSSGLKTLLFQLLSAKYKGISLARTLPHIRPDFYRTHLQASRIFNEFFDARDLNTSLVRHFQYKLEHLLRMEDRNSMAFSLESRVPYLDYRLIEAGLAISADEKIRRGETKVLQKGALGQYTIPRILDRKDKIGFGTPQDEWLATGAWQAVLEDCCHYCTRTFPDVFLPTLRRRLPRTGSDGWKIIQLATWHQLDWSCAN